MLFAVLQFGGTIQVSHEHPIQSISMIAAIITFFYGVFILPVFALLGGLPLFAPQVRHSKVLFTLCISVLCVPGLLLLNMAGWLFYLPLMGPVNNFQRTHKIKEPTTREGVTLPAGSTVVDADVGSRTYTVKLPAPTMAGGMLWTGELEVDAKELDAAESLLSGTLAEPHVFQGVPCAAAKATLARHSAECILSQDIAIHGFLLAAGKFVSVRFDDRAAITSIEEGTLAVPLQFQGTAWPAGLRIKPNEATAAELQGTDTKPGKTPGYLCVERGSSAVFHGATLRGPAEVRFYPDYAQAANSCDDPDDDIIMRYGSIRTPDGVVHRQGHVDEGKTTWTWTDENVPAKYADGDFNPND